MSWAGVTRLAFNWRTWAALGVVALLAMLLVTWDQRDRAQALAASRAETITSLGAEKTKVEQDLAAARVAQQRAETTLGDFSNTAIANFQTQAEESARMSAQLAELNRRVRAAQQEIARADGSLRLDDPMPRGLRDALACASGDAVACVPAPETAAGVVPSGAADATRPASPVA